MSFAKSLFLILPTLIFSTGLANPQLARFESLAGNFDQVKRIKELDLEIKTAGDFRVLRPKIGAPVFFWNIKTPKPSKICIDDIGLVMNEKSMSFSEVGAEAGSQISDMLKIVSMDSKGIEESFKVEKVKDKMLLTPKAAEKSFFKSAELTLNSEGLVRRLVLTEKSADQMDIQFSNLKAQSKPSARVEKCPR